MSGLTADFKKRCEGIALRERRALGLKVSSPLSGAALAEKQGVTVIGPLDLPGLFPIITPEMAQHVLDGSLSGFLLQLPNEPPRILINPNHAPVRQESTFMHELSHLILKHKSETIATLLSGQRNQSQEEEAAYLGGCLQIPKVGLEWARQVGLSSARTAQHFGASEAMVLFRCRRTGICLS